MKYRGLFRLLNKKELPGVGEDETDMSKIYYNQGYQLNYGAPMVFSPTRAIPRQPTHAVHE